MWNCVWHMRNLYKRQKAIDAKDRATAIDIKVQLREKEAERKRVETMSVTDALTGLGNRYSLEREAVHIIRDAGGERITVGVLDIDCFKQLQRYLRAYSGRPLPEGGGGYSERGSDGLRTCLPVWRG